MTAADDHNYNNSSECYMCQKPFDFKVKVRDHSHCSGKYIGAACQQCNLRRQMPNRLKIFVHNCAQYDMHFIIKALPEFKEQKTNISVLPYNSENFYILRFNCFKFVDTKISLGITIATYKQS